MHTKFNNGDFVISSKLGDGTFGEVYAATCKKDAKKVVLKVIPFHNERRKKIFLRESIITQKLLQLSSSASSNIITVDCCYYNQKVGVLVMEKMDCDLLDYIMRNRSISEHTSKMIFKEICKAIYVCHSNGISHLDVKPDNVLLKFKDEKFEEIDSVKLTDFGFSFDFSKRTNKLDNNNVFGYNFEFNLGVGTKEYRAPETTFGTPYLADKVDIWGLGITLFAMITGSFPFAEVDGAIVCNDFNLIRENTKDDKCYDLILNMLQIDPNSRYNILQVLSHPWLNE